MKESTIASYRASLPWQPPKLPEGNNIPTGDMPEDKVLISDAHIAKANTVFPRLLELLIPVAENSTCERAVISVYGGSGVGKSETASLLTYYLNKTGVGAYTLSGDNYPHRIPKNNDAERLRIYTQSGESGLQDYLGTPNEINFQEINDIISCFKRGEDAITLKRMGRDEDSIWRETVDFTDIHVLVIEWTHGNNDNLQGVDIPVFLYSTPSETLAHRKARARDKDTDSPFTNLVLGIEAKLLESQVSKAKIILSKNCRIMTCSEFEHKVKNGAILNAYPDSMGGTMADIVKLLQRSELNNAFQGFYILPSVFNSDLDRGFSIIDYELNEVLASKNDLEAIKQMGISLKLDFVLNHASVQSKQFTDILVNGESSEYKDFFIDWNKFWDGYGIMTDEGYIQPDPKYIKDMFFRKPGLPLLMVTLPDGTRKPYWNTFYQEVQYIDTDTQEQVKREKYLGQMDLNIKSPLVWQFYDKTLRKLADYGAEIIRLDAFAYAPKEPGARNFLNDPGTWDFLSKIRELANKYSLRLLPEIHSEYREGIHEKLADEGYLTYDFFLPGLLIHALEKGTAEYLKKWISDIQQKGIHPVNMLGCHDGIPLLDLRGLLPDKDIDELIQTIVERGGYVKDLHGSSKMYYQVNATYFSALGEDESKMLLARAVQMFVPGRPQVWYLDLFGGKNDYEAVRLAGAGGHKEINRTNLTPVHIEQALQSNIVQKQIELLRLRNTNPAFADGAKLTILDTKPSVLGLKWSINGYSTTLTADFELGSYEISS